MAVQGITRPSGGTPGNNATRNIGSWLWGLAKGILRYYSLLLLLVAWQLIAISGLVNNRVFPALDVIWNRLVILWNNGDLVYHAQYTVGRAMLGLGLATLVAVPLGLWMGRSRLVERLFDPLFSVGYPIPKIAIYPVFTFLLGLDTEPKVALVFLECLFPLVLNSYYGAKNVNRNHIWAAQNMGTSQFDIFRKVILPSAAPSIFSGLRVAMPVSLIIVIITEMIGSSTGLGFLIYDASSSFKYSGVFAGAVVIALIGFLLDRLVVFLRNRLIHW